MSQNATPNPYSLLQETLQPDLYVLFVGHNPGLNTSTQPYPYAQTTNHFWSLLKVSGITPTDRDSITFKPGSILAKEAQYDEALPPSASYDLPWSYDVGLIELCQQPTRDIGRLSKKEAQDGVIQLEWEVAKHKHEAVAVVGKEIWRAIYKVKMGRDIKDEDFRYGWQGEALWMGKVENGKAAIIVEEGITNRKLSTDGDTDVMNEVAAGMDWWPGAYVFVLPSTNEAATFMSKLEKTGIWMELGDWVAERRAEDAEEEEEEEE